LFRLIKQTLILIIICTSFGQIPIPDKLPQNSIPSDLLAKIHSVKTILAIKKNVMNDKFWESGISSHGLTREIDNVSTLYRECSKGIVLLSSLNSTSLGAGAIINSAGQFITNAHVVGNDDKMLVWFYDPDISQIKDFKSDSCYLAKVVAVDNVRDLSLLSINKTEKVFHPLDFGANEKIEITQEVFSIGHPKTLVWSFTKGFISQLRKNFEWEYDETTFHVANVIQVQMSSNPGDSGSPLFNENGQLIGLNSFRLQDGDGTNFAIQLNEINSFLDEVSNNKHILLAVSHSNLFYSLTNIPKYYDTNDDGINDIEIYDKDNNGTLEYMLIDSDYNGIMDDVAIDTNDDGVHDLFYTFVKLFE
jgi:S1-C subfamily serine protease|tara:strand:+ start:247 stop:1332 length:1086 start_codon:yes stop_codon:yes gene_type:complete